MCMCMCSTWSTTKIPCGCCELMQLLQGHIFFHELAHQGLRYPAVVLIDKYRLTSLLRLVLSHDICVTLFMLPFQQLTLEFVSSLYVLRKDVGLSSFPFKHRSQLHVPATQPATPSQFGGPPGKPTLISPYQARDSQTVGTFSTKFSRLWVSVQLRTRGGLQAVVRSEQNSLCRVRSALQTRPISWMPQKTSRKGVILHT